MIARHWRGVARPDSEATYLEHLRTDTFPSIRRIEGFVDAAIHKRRISNGVEFLIVTRWLSMDSIAKFAGNDPEIAVVPTHVREMMLDYDAKVRHYDVVEV